MTFGAEIWGPAAINAAASIFSGWLGGKGNANQETPMQKRQRQLVDQLLASLSGQGPFNDLFNGDQEAFNKAFVEPAQSMFRNKIAPQIQQGYIASGQQRGTGLDDQLLRAGVDLDSMLNSAYADFQQNALNRKQNAIGSILGAGSGAQNRPSGGQDLLSGLSGYLSGDGFSDAISGLFKKNDNSTSPNNQPNSQLPRKGFAPSWNDYKNWGLNDPRWG